MKDEYLDWLFKYSNLKGSAKFSYDLFLGVIGVVISIVFIWLAPNRNLIWVGIKVVVVIMIMLIILLLRMDTSKLVSYLCFKPCTIKHNYIDKAGKAVGLFISSLVFFDNAFAVYLGIWISWNNSI